jgi:hypothetical protein
MEMELQRSDTKDFSQVGALALVPTGTLLSIVFPNALLSQFCAIKTEFVTRLNAMVAE